MTQILKQRSRHRPKHVKTKTNSIVQNTETKEAVITANFYFRFQALRHLEDMTGISSALKVIFI